MNSGTHTPEASKRDADGIPLPPDLSTVPNRHLSDLTLEELHECLAYYEYKIARTKHWGAALAQYDSRRRQVYAELKERDKP